MTPRWMRRELPLAALGLAAGLALFELGVRWLEPQPAARYAYSADTFYAPIPGARFVYRRREFAVPVAYNAHGMRDRERSLAKPPGTLRVALAGDSQTEAKEVPFDSTWGQRLERELDGRWPGTRVEVLNFGVSGFGTVASLARFESLGRRFAPDLVVYLFNENDPADNLDAAERRLYTLRGEDLELRRLAETPSGRIRRAVLDPIKHHTHSYGFLKFRLAAWSARRAAAAGPKAGARNREAGPDAGPGAAADATEREAWRVTGAALARFAEAARAAGAELVVAQAGSRTPDATARLNAACARAGALHVDLQPALAAAGPVHFRWDGHWREAGHRVAAAALVPVVAARLEAVRAAGGAPP